MSTCLSAILPGVPLRFATALPLAGYGRGVIVTSVEGRPIKINGNPRHPASLGAYRHVRGSCSAVALRSGPLEGAVQRRPHSAVERFQGGIAAAVSLKRSRAQGAGLALLTGRVTSPTLLEQIDGADKRALPQGEMVSLRAGRRRRG